MGRIKFLVSSIKTINDIKGPGVPWGSKWDNIWFVFFIHPNKTIAIHLTRDNGRVITRCDVIENTWGYKAKKFINKIDKKTVRIKLGTPFSEFFNVNFTSFINIETIFVKIFLDEFFNTHISFGINSTKINTIIQDKDIIEDLGSKTENKFVIILYFFLFVK